MKHIHSCCLVLVLFVLACSGGREKTETLIRANTLHLESMTIHEALESRLIQLRAQAIYRKDSISLMKTDSHLNLVTLWEEAMIEVPGFEHRHKHSEHHDHKPAPQMTDESMLEFQYNAKKAITELAEETKKIRTSK